MSRLGIIGYPLSHTLSPVMQKKALESVGMGAWTYEVLETERKNLEVQIKYLRENFRGFNVTIPYKEVIIPYLDELDFSAKISGAVNTVVIDDGKMKGYNTDGLGFVKGLEEAGFDYQDVRVLMIGSGGAAKGIFAALMLKNVQKIDIVARNREKSAALLKSLPLEIKGKWIDFSHIEDMDISEYDLYINTIPIGMYPKEEEILPFNYEKMESGKWAVDIIYRPGKTIFLRKAEEKGLIIHNGVDMLVHQGALAFQYWTGIKAPVAIMKKALLEALRKG